jgi:tRNA pseudouridine55 synthase
MHSELNGILALDKPAGITSAKAVAEVKKALGAAKVGHTGTLDPFATGVLLCCINQATRLARFFLHGTKRYDAVLRLGVATDTQDATGNVVRTDAVPALSEEELVTAFGRFEGSQWQKPPVYSALKHCGTPLYRLARRGNPVQKPPRQVHLALRILEIALPDVRFEVTCTAGTYVRTVCADIGETIGCGGHLVHLRRTASCGFTLDHAIALDTLKSSDRVDSRIVPMAECLKQIPTIRADGELLQHLLHGKMLPAEFLAGHSGLTVATLQTADYLKVVDEDGRLRAVLQADDEGAKYNYCCVFN